MCLFWLLVALPSSHQHFGKSNMASCMPGLLVCRVFLERETRKVFRETLGAGGQSERRLSRLKKGRTSTPMALRSPLLAAVLWH